MNLQIIFYTIVFFLSSTLSAMNAPDLREQLRIAVKDNQTELALALIDAGAPVNLEPFKPTDLYGMYGENDLKLSALQWAAKNGNEMLVRALIQAGSSLSIDKIPTDAVLHIFTGSEADEVVSYEKTALIYAAENGNVACVKELLAAKADIDEMDRQKNTALIWAVKSGHSDCVRELIAANAHVNVGSPLLVAFQKGDVASIRALIAAKAEVNDQNQEGTTPLIWAVSTGDVLCVRELIGAKADINYITHNNKTALINAVGWAHKEIVEELIGAGARLRWKGARKVGESGELERIPSVLFKAAGNTHAPMCELVIEGLLKIPNDKQKLSIIVFLGLMKRKIPLIGQAVAYRDRDAFFKNFFREAVYKQNRNNFAESVAGEEVANLELFGKHAFSFIQQDPRFKKYFNSSNATQSPFNNCTLQ